MTGGRPATLTQGPNSSPWILSINTGEDFRHGLPTRGSFQFEFDRRSDREQSLRGLLVQTSSSEQLAPIIGAVVSCKRDDHTC